MDLRDEINQIIGQKEDSSLEYKAILPPSRTIAQLISSFANTNGGYIVLGVLEKPGGDIEVVGLSEDFLADTITRKALNLLTPPPTVYHEYVLYNCKKLYAIKVEKSDTSISVENKVYFREGSNVKLLKPAEMSFNPHGYMKIKAANAQLEIYKNMATNAKTRLIEHYQSIIKIIDDLGSMLYPDDPNVPTTDQEGKVLSRILLSSFVDNFETYLSDLLYEIYIADSRNLISKEQVTIQEVLKCSDISEFVEYWAKKKIRELQKGSVKGFVKDNKRIRDLNVLDQARQDEIEKLLQIRHLYCHRNGIVDEKFLKYFTGLFTLNSEYRITISDICDKLLYLASIVNAIDVAAIAKYNLAHIGA